MLKLIIHVIVLVFYTSNFFDAWENLPTGMLKSKYVNFSILQKLGGKLFV